MIGRRWNRLVGLQALLEHERRLVAVPAVARTRALARARAALVVPQVAPPSPVWVSRPPRFSRWLAAAGVAFVVGAASGVAAYELEVRVRSVPTGVAEAEPLPPARSDRPPARAPILEPLAPPAPLPWRSHASADARVEWRLLGRARAAMLREDFAAALPPLAEHARRFKDGGLAEEREALRVKALVGLGRDREAERAAAAFAARFPRSPLVGAVNRISASGF